MPGSRSQDAALEAQSGPLTLEQLAENARESDRRWAKTGDPHWLNRRSFWEYEYAKRKHQDV